MTRKRSDYDAALRQLLQEGPIVLFQTAGIPVPVQILPSEFGNALQLRADFVARAASGEIVHIECQSRNDRHMPERMLEYRLPIKRFTGRPPLQYVLYAGHAKLNMRDSLVEPGLDYHYPIIELSRLQPDVLMNSPHLADNFFSVLSAKSGLRSLTGTILRRTEERKQRVEPAMELLLILFKLRGFGLKDALEVINVPEILDLTRFPKLKKSVALVMEKGLEKGLEKGREEGLEVGRRRLLMQLEKRFGRLPSAALREIHRADSTRLDELSLRLFDAGTLKDLLR